MALLTVGPTFDETKNKINFVTNIGDLEFRNLVVRCEQDERNFHTWFLVTGWCIETNII